MTATHELVDSSPAIVERHDKDDVLVLEPCRETRYVRLMQRVLLIASGMLIASLGVMFVFPMELFGPSQAYRKATWMMAVLFAPLGTWFIILGVWLIIHSIAFSDRREVATTVRWRHNSP